MSWQAEVVDALAAAKRAGIDFHTAWNHAMLRHPPRCRDLGRERPVLFGEDAEESVVDCFRRACDDAWHGRRPALRYLSAEGLEDGVPFARPKTRPMTLGPA